MEPSQASIPRGHYFAFRLLDAEGYAGYTIHWFFNGCRIPGAHKAELGFYHMRPRFDGEYKALLVKGQEILSSNTVKLQTIATDAEAVVVSEEAEAVAPSECFFDPLAPEAEPPSVEAENKKKTFLQKALSKAKKAA